MIGQGHTLLQSPDESGTCGTEERGLKTHRRITNHLFFFFFTHIPSSFKLRNNFDLILDIFLPDGSFVCTKGSFFFLNGKMPPF